MMIARNSPTWPPSSDSNVVAAICFGNRADVTRIAFSRDGRLLATAGDDGVVRVREVASGKEVIAIDHDFPARAIALSADGAVLAVGTWQRAAGSANFLWDVKSGKPLGEFPLGQRRLHSIEFGPDAGYEWIRRRRRHLVVAVFRRRRRLLQMFFAIGDASCRMCVKLGRPFDTPMAGT